MISLEFCDEKRNTERGENRKNGPPDAGPERHNANKNQFTEFISLI